MQILNHICRIENQYKTQIYKFLKGVKIDPMDSKWRKRKNLCEVEKFKWNNAFCLRLKLEKCL